MNPNFQKLLKTIEDFEYKSELSMFSESQKSEKKSNEFLVDIVMNLKKEVD